MHEHVEFCNYVRKKLYLYGIISVSLDVFLDSNLTLVDINVDLLLKLLCYILSGYGAVEPAVLAVLHLYFDLLSVDAVGECLSRLLFLAELELLGFLLVLKLVGSLGICGNCLFLREEEVACVSVGNVYDLVLFALSFTSQSNITFILVGSFQCI